MKKIYFLFILSKKNNYVGNRYRFKNIDLSCILLIKLASGMLFQSGIGCGSIPEIENGKIKGIKNGSFMDKRPVQCDQGYEYVGPGTITCQHDGQWSFPGVCSKGKPHTLFIFHRKIGESFQR